MSAATDPCDALLRKLSAFVRDEQQAALQRLREVWQKPLADKLQAGWTQRFTHLERAQGGLVWAYPDGSDARFREGDLLALHLGSPLDDRLAQALTFERDDDERWLLGGTEVAAALAAYTAGPCYADPGTIDLTPWFDLTLEEIGTSKLGRERLLPLLAGTLGITFDDRDVVQGQRKARAAGFDDRQAAAVGLMFGAEQVACIRGPPGTGKTRVLAYAVRLMVERGERVLVTSHTHTAINNALNAVHARGVATLKVGSEARRKGLHSAIACRPRLVAWEERPSSGGYAVGATPFATFGARLAGATFHTVVFDEASQITMALALMAMRKGERCVFIGDERQLPPVLLSRSVLGGDCESVFAALTARDADHTVMLDRTYRMNRGLAEWPSRTYYDDALQSAGANRERRLNLTRVPQRFAAVFDPAASGVFIATRDRTARASNPADAQLVVELCAAAADGGVALESIGIVTPYRAQGRLIRKLLAARFGSSAARSIVADTVERMQGQERELIIVSLASGDAVFLSAVAPFFYQPQRLNVSITRATVKLIVIGPESAPAFCSEPGIADATLRGWIEQYLDLLRHLKRIAL